jgi:hypothetical protein
MLGELTQYLGVVGVGAAVGAQERVGGVAGQLHLHLLQGPGECSISRVGLGK